MHRESKSAGRVRDVRRGADIHLPLSEDDAVVNMIFTVVAFLSD
jgi:hypothetical protein